MVAWWLFLVIAAVLVGIVHWIHHRRHMQRYHKALKRKITQLSAELRHARERRRQMHQEQRLMRAQRPEVLVTLERAVAEFTEVNWTPLLMAGDAYRRGSYPLYRPNQDAALMCFKAAAAAPDPTVAGTAQAKFVECRMEPLAREDVAGQDLPVQYAKLLCDKASQMMASGMVSRRPNFSSGPPQPAAVPVVSRPPPPIIPPDAQNVHDHAVMTGMRRRLTELPGAGDADTAIDHVRHAVLEARDVSEAEKLDALDVLDALSDVTHSTLDHSQKDALAKVWHRISEIPETQHRDNAAETLVKQLATGIEDGSRVCSTGLMARIVGSLDGVVDDPHQAKPMWAVREELATLAAKIRDDGGDADRFAAEAERLYVGDLELSPKIVAPIINDMKAGFA